MTQQLRQLKGGKFSNRYVIRARLASQTPFHIGDGSTIPRKGMIDDETKKEFLINAVVTDGNNRAYIPGSTLRGALRDWLRQGNKGMTENMNGNSENDIKISSELERIFGTQHNEGKLEVWDAYFTTPVNTATDTNGQMCYWDNGRMTFVAKSVAINPATGTAEKGKLYNYELVPAGAEFAATFSAQNLSPEEVDILMAVLNGFNDETNPIVIGAMTKLDFGRFKIDISEIYCLDDIGKWRELAKTDNRKRAGYDLIIDKQFDMNKNMPERFSKLCKAKLPDPVAANIHSETWNLNLETPLVIRSGGHFVWKNADKKKTRNYRMEFNWMQTEKTGDFHHVSDLYHSVEIQDKKIVPYYHIPSSSVRGVLRAWTIEHLLKRDYWDIEKHLKSLKEDDLKNKSDNLKKLEPILDLFGFAVEGTDKAVTKKFTKAGRLKIIVDRFTSTAEIPSVDGDWVNNNNFGPANARRHVKPRNPLDRITQAAKDSGLHHNLEFSEGQAFNVTFKIRNAKTEEQRKFDEMLLIKWREEINAGMIRVGGLTGIGRGRLTERTYATKGGKNV